MAYKICLKRFLLTSVYYITDEIHLNFEFIKETLLASQKGRPETIFGVSFLFQFYKPKTA